jgi:hypothetical protein
MAINGINDRSVIYTLDPDADDELEWGGDIDKARSAALFFGPEFDGRSPCAVVFKLEPGFCDPLSSMHIHGADAINLVIQGSMKMDGVWLTPGMMKCTPAGEAYGDHEVGPDGVTFIEFLASRDGLQQTYVDPALQERFVQHPHFHLTQEIGAGLREGPRIRPGAEHLVQADEPD